MNYLTEDKFKDVAEDIFDLCVEYKRVFTSQEIADILRKHASQDGCVRFPGITASANAIAYQLEIGRENHSCPVDDKTIAEWLRDLANQLDPSQSRKGNDGSNYPIKSLPTPPAKEEKAL